MFPTSGQTFMFSTSGGGGDDDGVDGDGVDDHAGGVYVVYNDDSMDGDGDDLWAAGRVPPGHVP